MKTNLVLGVMALGLAMCGCQTQSPPELGEPLAGLTPDEGASFERGKEIFLRRFDPQRGLGPLFNGNSCAECHEDPVLGGEGDEVETHAARFANLACDLLFQEGGPVIQQDATPLLRAKGIAKEQVPRGATVARRSSPALFGFGLVDNIPDETILRHEDPNDANGDGIRGRAKWASRLRCRPGRKPSMAHRSRPIPTQHRILKSTWPTSKV
jgi:CxxC motif-containing protein (DUF1111 family)